MTTEIHALHAADNLQSQLLSLPGRRGPKLLRQHQYLLNLLPEVFLKLHLKPFSCVNFENFNKVYKAGIPSYSAIRPPIPLVQKTDR